MAEQVRVVARTGARVAAVALALALSACSRTPADDLYTGKSFVTGQDERFRSDGFAEALPDALVKVSGDQALLTDPRVAALAANAALLVASITYHDRMAGIPIGDEQGTRDRPYDLEVAFKHDAIDAALKTLGREPWTGARPAIGVSVKVRNHGKSYWLTRAGEDGSDQRDALNDAAWRSGLSITLPDAAPTIVVERVPPGDPPPVKFSERPELMGGLVWDDGFIGWHVDWVLQWRGKAHHWTVRDVSFDEAFRNAMRGTAQILSGHGDPADAAGAPMSATAPAQKG